MIDAAIRDGGVGTVRRPDSADQGDLVVGLLEDKATVKVLRRQDGQVWLMPRTPSCSPIPGDEAQILGKVLGVLRLLCGSDPHRLLPEEDRDSSVRGGSYQRLGDEFVRRSAALREAGRAAMP
ncbi:LexA family protein [Streptomyces mirabilis]|uniref:LexA family protein n=1 Tax=Streptomyces mirabilis TaxID=68239 RepID=UPI0036C6C4E6